MSARGFLGAGDLFIAKYNPATGLFDAPTGPFECTKFEIAPKSDIKEMASKGRTSYGQVIETVPVNQPAEFTIALPEVNRDSLLLALLGTNAVINDAAQTIANEVIAAKLDAWVPLAHANLKLAGLLVKDSAAVTTYVKDTDYAVNYALGWIKALKGGAITDAESLKVTYDTNARSGSKISGATNPQLRAKFTLHGINMADQLPCIVTVREAVLAASSAMDFLANDFASIELKGKLKTPTGALEPFTVELLDTASEA
jgi:hypothetical protein